MQKHRIFIAINLPETVKKQLSDQQYKWLELPCRWTKKENLHITLSFLGYLDTEDLPEIFKIAEAIAKKNEPFFLNLNKIIYDSQHQSKRGTGQVSKSPRMIWVEGQESKELGKLRQNLENSLAGFSSEPKDGKNRSFSPHITLGRLKMWEFREIEIEERPEINEDINFNFEVKSIEIMESRLGKKGPEYEILGSIPLK